MKKIEEIQTLVAVSIMLAIIPIDRWTFGILATTFIVLGHRIMTAMLRPYRRWTRMIGAALASIAMLLFILPAILQRY